MGKSRRGSRFSPAKLAGHSLTGMVLLALLVVGGYHSYLVCLDQREDCRLKAAELRAVERQIAEVESQNRLLSRQRDRLRTPAGIEEIAREKLGMVRQGEIAFVVEPGPPPPEPAEAEMPPGVTSEEPPLAEEETWWQRWLPGLLP